jgi:hypothetical protein
MNPDDLKKSWQAQTSHARLTLDADLLLKEVQRNQRTFTILIFWRDVREVVASLLMVPVILYMGAKIPLPWSWYLLVPALLWGGGFMAADWVWHKRSGPEPGQSLRRHVESSAKQVQHQIWLLRNVLWWYLLPPGFAILAFFGQVAWMTRAGGLKTVLFVAGLVLLVAAVFAGIYWLNQHAVRSELEPRYRELQTLQAGLNDAAEGGDSPSNPGQGTSKPNKKKWLGLLGIIGLLAGALLLLSLGDIAPTGSRWLAMAPPWIIRLCSARLDGSIAPSRIGRSSLPTNCAAHKAIRHCFSRQVTENCTPRPSAAITPWDGLSSSAIGVAEPCSITAATTP